MRAPLAALVLLAVAAAPAGARQGGPAVALGTGGDPRVAVAPDGGATVAWMRVDASAAADATAPLTAILATRSSKGARGFAATQQVAGEPIARGSLALARGDGGLRALAWLGDGTASADGAAPVRVATTAGGAFGAPRTLALPPRLPVLAGNGQMSLVSRRIFGLAVAVGGDGAIAVTACEADDRAGTQRVLAWVGDSVQRLGSCRETTQLATLADGRVAALWTGVPPGGSVVSPVAALTAERATGGTGFGEARIVSNPATPADDGSYTPGLTAGSGGDALAWWPGSPQFGGGAPGAAYRPRREQWGAPNVFSPAQLPLRSEIVGAVGANADAALAWFSVGGTAFVAETLGGRFTGPDLVPARVVAPQALAVDGGGRTLVVGQTARGTTLVTRSRAGAWSAQERVAGAAGGGAIGADAYDNALLVLATPPGRVVAVTLSAGPPRITRVRLNASRSRLSLRASEPASLALRATAPGRHARTQHAAVGAGRRAVRLGAGLRAVLAAHGARLVLRARDAGPGARVVRVRP